MYRGRQYLCEERLSTFANSNVTKRSPVVVQGQSVDEKACLDGTCGTTYSPFDMAEPDKKVSGTPLQIVEGVDFHPAPPITRFLAYVMDAAASGAIGLALHRFLGTWLLNAMGNDSYIGMTLNTSLWFMTILGYWVVIPAVTGATPAKMLFQMRIISEVPGPVTLVQILQREILGHAATILSLGMGFLFLSTRDEKNRALNDRLSETRLIHFSSPRPELYKVQDLHADTTDGIWLSYEVEGGTGTISVPGRRSTVPAAAVAPVTADASVSGEGDHIEAMAAPEVEDTAAAPASPGVGDITAAPAAAVVDDTTAVPAAPDVPPVPPPKTGSLYARPATETAYERRQRAAKGPTVLDMAEALRRTAELVRQGQLMEKVLDRKRQE